VGHPPCGRGGGEGGQGGECQVWGRGGGEVGERGGVVLVVVWIGGLGAAREKCWLVGLMPVDGILMSVLLGPADRREGGCGCGDAPAGQAAFCASSAAVAVASDV
jgi:hypothetical protein